MPAGKGLDIPALAVRVFDSVCAHYDAHPELNLPARRTIAPGEARSIAWDGEQMVLTFSGVGYGAAPGVGGINPRRQGNPISSMGLRHVVFTVQVVRCVPESQDGSTPPSTEALRGSALQLMTDAGNLSQALVDVCTRVQGGLPPGTQCQAGAVEVLGPAGAFAGVEGSIAVTAGLLA